MWNEARIINATANLLMVLAVSALLVGLSVWVVRLPVFDVTRIAIVPAEDGEFRYVSPDVVRSAIAGRLIGNFFTMNLGQAREAFESAAWVRRASVRRVWPNQLIVEVEEQQPLALWNDNQMINTWGEVFTANRAVLDNEDSLPQFYGPDGSQGLIVQRYAELGRWFEQLGLSVKTLELSNRYALEAQLSDGLRLVLGRDPGADTVNPQAGVPGAIPFGARIERFVRNWPTAVAQLKGRGIERVDLRYPNGFAITLAQAPAPITSNKKR